MKLRKRGRMALWGAASAALVASVVLTSAKGAHSPVGWLLWSEAAICGAVAGAATASMFGRSGRLGAVFALLGGVAATTIALALFGSGPVAWLAPKAFAGFAADPGSALAGAALVALAVGATAHLVETVIRRIDGAG
ncbi:MAG: hypothetical protein EA355_09100 [Rhodobacteraceae bacterium]|nr:MAG: hypothetical protein EA355_09100 [Paracoccaceae bacterium]